MRSAKPWNQGGTSISEFPLSCGAAYIKTYVQPLQREVKMHQVDAKLMSPNVFLVFNSDCFLWDKGSLVSQSPGSTAKHWQHCGTSVKRCSHNCGGYFPSTLCLPTAGHAKGAAGKTNFQVSTQIYNTNPPTPSQLYLLVIPEPPRSSISCHWGYQGRELEKGINNIKCKVQCHLQFE